MAMKNKFSLILITATIFSVFTACEKKNESKYVTVTLGAQANTVDDGFYAVSENESFTITKASLNQSEIDIFCFYEAETGNNIALASPGTGITGIFFGIAAPANWTIQNTTYFYQTALTASQFDAVQEKDNLIVSSFSQDNARRKAKDVQVGQVWSFKTADEYYGLLKVTEVIQGSDGSVKFLVKAMKPAP
jgi:hypothetical protein